MAEIKTKRGDVILVDDEDFETLSAFTWSLDGAGGYAGRKIPGIKGTHRMHRQIMGLVNGDTGRVDHINGNKLDNRRENLRVCEHGQNLCNRGAPQNNMSGYKGVYFNKKLSKWAAGIGAEGKKYHLGVYESREHAHTAYCLAAYLFHGEFANAGV